MSTAQNTASPRGPRVKHQHSKSASQAPTSNAGRQSQRRQKGNRNQNGNNGGAQSKLDGSPSRNPGAVQDPALTDGALPSGEEPSIPKSSRKSKKNGQPQQSSDRILSPPNVPIGSLTDSELPPHNASATPAKAQAAYAGPTFHASPAPSALPIPKFLSRSVPAKSRADPPTPPPAEGSGSNSPGSPSPPSPSRAPIAIPSRHEDSPLDMLFKADRAERARNVTDSPASGTFSPNPSAVHNAKHHPKHDSQTSLNTMFPIELDAESKKPRPSPPPFSPNGFRSVTAPSSIPVVNNSGSPTQDSPDVMQDLLSRLSQSQKKPAASTPPRVADHAPSDPSSRHQTPSPFHNGQSAHRSVSGPNTPAPPTQEPPPNFFYGNRNLSPLFKAAKTDSPKRNSGLRTEITATSPMIPQEGFGPPIADIRTNGHVNSPNRQPNFANAPQGPRRGSAPFIQPFQEIPNNRKPRTPGRRAHHPRPDSYPHTNGSNAFPPPRPAAAEAKPSAINPFIPASVQAKKYSTTTAPTPPPTTTATKTTTITPDSLALEQDLKRLLNLNLNATNGAASSGAQ